MKVDYETAMNDILESAYEITKEIPVRQISQVKPELEIQPGETIRPGTHLFVEGIGGGDDGLAAKVRYFQDDKTSHGYLFVDELIESSEWVFSRIIWESPSC